MDSHITGPRGKLGLGSVVSLITTGALFGTTAAGTVFVTETLGASQKTPLLVEIMGQIVTAFNGTGAAFTLQQTNMDGSGATSLATIAGFTANKFNLFFYLTADKRFNLVYATGTTPTTGEGYYSIKVTGSGFLPPR